MNLLAPRTERDAFRDSAYAYAGVHYHRTGLFRRLLRFLWRRA